MNLKIAGLPQMSDEYVHGVAGDVPWAAGSEHNLG